jgi:hypothetical protein
MNRKPLRRVSAKRRRLMVARKPVVQAVFERDNYTCRAQGMPGVGECFGPLTPHEILSRSRAGRTDENLLNADGMLTLCAHHNTWCEDHPPEAEALGLTMHAWDVSDLSADQCETGCVPGAVGSTAHPRSGSSRVATRLPHILPGPATSGDAPLPERRSADQSPLVSGSLGRGAFDSKAHYSTKDDAA